MDAALEGVVPELEGVEFVDELAGMLLRCARLAGPPELPVDALFCLSRRLPAGGGAGPDAPGELADPAVPLAKSLELEEPNNSGGRNKTS